MRSWLTKIEQLPIIEKDRASFFWPWRTRPRQRQALLQLIAVAAEEKVPSVDLLEAWARDERGLQQFRVRKLVKRLRGGASLADAVEQTPGVLADDQVLAIRFGAQSGTIAETARSLIEESNSLILARRDLRQNLIYCGIVAIIAVLATFFIHIKLLPHIASLGMDFSVMTPGVLIASISMANFVEQFWWLLAAIALFIAWLTFTARGGRFFRNRIASKVLWSLSDLRIADLLQKLAISAKAGRPLAGALSTLARYHYVPAIRQKLLFVRNEVEQGADPWQSMAAVGLLSDAEARALVASDELKNRVWVLERLAGAKRFHTSRRLQRWYTLATPAILLALGGYVLFQAMTLFVPLTRFITASF